MKHGWRIWASLAFLWAGCLHRQPADKAGELQPRFYRIESLEGRAEYAIAGEMFAPVSRDRDLPAGGLLRTFPGSVISLAGPRHERLLIADSALVLLTPEYLSCYRPTQTSGPDSERTARLMGKLGALPEGFRNEVKLSPPEQPSDPAARVAEPPRHSKPPTVKGGRSQTRFPEPSPMPLPIPSDRVEATPDPPVKGPTKAPTTGLEKASFREILDELDHVKSDMDSARGSSK
jgi:hypothetical protein